MKSIDKRTDYLAIRYFPGKGRGVIALRNIKADTLIERSPVIIIPANQSQILSTTAAGDYPFDWKTEDEDGEAIVLGWGSLFNHSIEANVVYRRDYEEKCITFYTLRDIRAGEELVYNYHEIWFDIAES